MFHSADVEDLDLSSFDTTSLTNMDTMFGLLKSSSINLTSFDLSKVTNTNYLFYNAFLTGTYYVRSQTEAEMLNGNPYTPDGLLFVPMPE